MTSQNKKKRKERKKKNTNDFKSTRKNVLHLKIKTNTKQNMSQKSMINKNYQPLLVATHLCTDHPPEGQRTMSHKPQKQAGAEWFGTQRTGDATTATRIRYKDTQIHLYMQGQSMNISILLCFFIENLDVVISEKDDQHI